MLSGKLIGAIGAQKEKISTQEITAIGSLDLTRPIIYLTAYRFTTNRARSLTALIIFMYTVGNVYTRQKCKNGHDLFKPIMHYLMH